MTRTTHNLPDNINPADDVCYPLFVPNDDQWRRYLIRQIRTLTFDRHWERDDVDGADTLAVRKRWQESTLSPLLDAIQNNTPCDEDNSLGQCYRMDTTTEAFTFYPNDPFTGEGDVILSGLKLLQWRDEEIVGSKVWEAIADALGFISGYRSTDVLVFPDLEALSTNILTNFSGWVNLFTSFPFPYALIEFEGDGQLEVELVNFPFGGAALIVPDFPDNLSDMIDIIVDFFDNDGTLPQQWILTELDRDLSPPVPELVVTQVQELEFTESGEHTVHVVFLPEINIAPPSINIFGGIREIEACGNIKIKGSQTGTLYDEVRAADDIAKRQGVIGVTTIDDICKGVECGMRNYHASAIGNPNGANMQFPVSIFTEPNEDGDRTGIDTTTVSSGVTPISASAQAQIFGGNKIANEQIADIVQTIIDEHTAGTTLQSTLSILHAQWTLEDNYLTPYVTQVYADLDLPTSVFNTWTNLSHILFCSGMNSKALGKFIVSNAPTGERDTALLFPDAIAVEQWKEWVTSGKSSPSLGFASTPCYRQPDRSGFITPDMLFDGTTGARYLNDLFVEHGAKPANNRWQITTSGYFEHTPSGSIHDLWFLNGLTQQLEMKRAGISQHVGIPDPLYNTQHVYEAYFQDTQSSDHDGIYYASRPNWQAVDVAAKDKNGNVIQGLTITLKDLGVT